MNINSESWHALVSKLAHTDAAKTTIVLKGPRNAIDTVPNIFYNYTANNYRTIIG